MSPAPRHPVLPVQAEAPGPGWRLRGPRDQHGGGGCPPSFWGAPPAEGVPLTVGPWTPAWEAALYPALDMCALSCGRTAVCGVGAARSRGLGASAQARCDGEVLRSVLTWHSQGCCLWGSVAGCLSAPHVSGRGVALQPPCPSARAKLGAALDSGLAGLQWTRSLWAGRTDSLSLLLVH